MTLDRDKAPAAAGHLPQKVQPRCGAGLAQPATRASAPQPNAATAAGWSEPLAARDADTALKWRAFARCFNHDLTAHLTHMNKALLWRRMLQRMRLANYRSVDAYVRHLQQDAAERVALRQSLCAGFTCFFRDPDTFEQLQQVHAAALWLRDKPLRVWVPGCSTGQEAYSWAMCLLDARPQHSHQTLTIIATDIDRAALNIACEGLYTPEQLQGVGAARLARYFVREGQGFRISRVARATVTFRRHDILGRGRIRHIDAISCRNLLSAMTPSVQRRITRRCAAVLADGGLFVVGSTENISGADRWFVALDRARHIYQRRPQKPRIGQKHRLLSSAVTHLDLPDNAGSSGTNALCALELSGGLSAWTQGVSVP